MAITLVYTSSNSSYPSGTETFSTPSAMRSWLTGTLGQAKLTTAVLTGSASGSMADLFSGCSTMTSCDCSGLDVSGATAMYNMFYGTSKLTSLDVSTWNTSNVTMFHSMFSATGLSTLDITNFKLTSATLINSMFAWSKLVTIYCNEDWSTEYSISQANSVFSGCSKLVGSISYDSSKVGIAYANPTTGYFTTKQTTIPIIVNGTQMEHIIVNGVEMTSVYVNGTQIL